MSLSSLPLAHRERGLCRGIEGRAKGDASVASPSNDFPSSHTTSLNDEERYIVAYIITANPPDQENEPDAELSDLVIDSLLLGRPL